jgi:hypothetical protein
MQEIALKQIPTEIATAPRSPLQPTRRLQGRKTMRIVSRGVAITIAALIVTAPMRAYSQVIPREQREIMLADPQIKYHSGALYRNCIPNPDVEWFNKVSGIRTQATGNPQQQPGELPPLKRVGDHYEAVNGHISGEIWQTPTGTLGAPPCIYDPGVVEKAVATEKVFRAEETRVAQLKEQAAKEAAAAKAAKRAQEIATLPLTIDTITSNVEQVEKFIAEYDARTVNSSNVADRLEKATHAATEASDLLQKVRAGRSSEDDSATRKLEAQAIAVESHLADLTTRINKIPQEIATAKAAEEEAAQLKQLQNKKLLIKPLTRKKLELVI